MTALVVVAAVLAYLLPTVVFARRFYRSYRWNYSGAVIGNSLTALAFGLVWPLSLVVMMVSWRNPTLNERELELIRREDRVRAMERELGL